MDKTVSDIIDIKKIDRNKLNLIVAGCGTGKSYFAINKLNKMLREINIEINLQDMCFVTSRRITANQQIDDAEYKSNVEGYSWQTSKTCEKIQIMSYKQFADNFVGGFGKKRFKVVVFDEIHAIEADASYQECMKKTKCYIQDKIGEVLIIGMTATDDLLTNSTMGVEINYMLDKPFFKYKVTDNLVTTFPTKLSSLLNELGGNSMIMTATVKQAKTLNNNLNDSVIICGKDNKEYDSSMKDITDYIVKNKSFPPGVKTLITTSCAREGFELSSKNFTLDNTVVYGGDIVSVVQFVGRYRGNTKNLILVADYFSKNSKHELQIKQIEEFSKYINGDNKSKYFQMIKHICSRTINKQQWGNFDVEYLFLHWFNEEWTNKLIYSKAHKGEITDMATKLGLRKQTKKSHTFNSIVKLLEKHKFQFIAKGERTRTSSKLIKDNTGSEHIGKTHISPYIVGRRDMNF